MGKAAGSITLLLSRLAERDELAVEAIWQRYVERIHGAARPVITGLAPGAGDEEDVAQSAFYAFCEAAASDRLPPIASRNELWRLLLTIIRRKAINRLRHEFRQRRGGGIAVRPPSEVNCACDDACPPIQRVELQDTLDDLFARIDASGDARLADIARLRLEGHSNREIADRIGCVPRTVQRKLHVLEQLWMEHE